MTTAIRPSKYLLRPGSDPVIREFLGDLEERGFALIHLGGSMLTETSIKGGAGMRERIQLLPEDTPIRIPDILLQAVDPLGEDEVAYKPQGVAITV
jgi:hypothetical protein